MLYGVLPSFLTSLENGTKSLTRKLLVVQCKLLVLRRMDHFSLKISPEINNPLFSFSFIDQAFFPLPILSSFYIFLSALEGKTESLGQLVSECGN